jgi:beta-1,4-N-acetylglucosaminyltransferase
MPLQVVPASAHFARIPRSREVGQPYLSSVWTTLFAFWACVRLVARLRPAMLLCNGPGTCLPVCLAALLLNWAGVTDTRIVFVESVARVQHLSLTGRLLYPIADSMQVQWPQLVQRYVDVGYMRV